MNLNQKRVSVYNLTKSLEEQGLPSNFYRSVIAIEDAVEELADLANQNDENTVWGLSSYHIDFAKL